MCSTRVNTNIIIILATALSDCITCAERANKSIIVVFWLKPILVFQIAMYMCMIHAAWWHNEVLLCLGVVLTW